MKDPSAASISPILRVFLTFDGTITTALGAFHRTPITVEVLQQSEVCLSPSEAEFLEVEPGIKALARVARLAAGQKGLIQARSLILPDGLPRSLWAALHNSHTPLGALLNESGLSVIRDRHQIGRMPDAGGRRIWARRYRIHVGNKLTASVQEAFLDAMLDGKN